MCDEIKLLEYELVVFTSVIRFWLTSSRIGIFEGLPKINTASLAFVAESCLTPQMKAHKLFYHNRPYSATHFIPFGIFQVLFQAIMAKMTYDVIMMSHNRNFTKILGNVQI